MKLKSPLRLLVLSLFPSGRWVRLCDILPALEAEFTPERAVRKWKEQRKGEVTGELADVVRWGKRRLAMQQIHHFSSQGFVEWRGEGLEREYRLTESGEELKANH